MLALGAIGTKAAYAWVPLTSSLRRILILLPSPLRFPEKEPEFFSIAFPASCSGNALAQLQVNCDWDVFLQDI